MYINIRVFIISLAVGLFFVYILGPDIKKINVYPTPDNSGKIQYKDDADNCFVYKSSEVKCPTDESLIQPFQALKKDEKTSTSLFG